MKKKGWIIYTLLFISFLSCGHLKTTQIVPMIDPEATIFQQTNSVAYIKNGIVAIAVPLNDVKEVDAFGIVLVNKTEHSITFKQKDCWLLDQSGKSIKPISQSQKSFYLGKNFEPKFPQEFPTEVFRWNRGIQVRTSGFAALGEQADETTIMPQRKKEFFLYFRKKSTQSSKIRLIIPKVHNDSTEKDTTFVFKFQIQKS